MTILVFFFGFIVGGVFGGMLIYAGIKEYRKQLGLAPDPFEKQTIYTQESIDEIVTIEVSKTLSRIKEWTKGRNITKDKLRQFLNELRSEYVSK